MLYAAAAASAEEGSIVLRAGAHSELVATRCVICHSADYITSNAKVMTRARWETSIRKMIDKFGAPVSEPEARQIVDYLARNYSDSEGR
jgi:sulfite dehydrogenase